MGKQSDSLFICFKKSFDSAGRVVSYTIFIEFCIVIKVLVLVKCIYMKPMLKSEMANIW